MKQRMKASLTAEASLVIPIFFFAIMALCWMFVFSETEYRIEKGMLDAAGKISPFGTVIKTVTDKREDLYSDKLEVFKKLGLTDILTLEMDESVVRELVLISLDGDKTIASAVQGGMEGLDFSGSELYDGGGCINIVVSYVLKVPFATVGNIGIPQTQTLRYRYFTGEGASGSDEEEAKTDESEEDFMVYITESGKVYHTSLDCPSLKVTIRSCCDSEISELRNAGGGRYYPCEYCAKGDMPGELFYTTDGDRYHYSRTCRGLKRTVSEVLRSSVPERSACKRCGKETDSEEGGAGSSR